MPSDSLWTSFGVRPEISLPWTGTPFVVSRLTVEERVSGLFLVVVEIEPVAPHTFDPAECSASDMLGREVAIRLVRAGEGAGEPMRSWHGVVQQLTTVPVEEARRPHVFRLRLVPWLALWNLASRCRFWEDMTALDVIQTMLNQWQQGHRCEQRLAGGVESRRYCCQFQETDFHFFSRLLEEEGIFYYFEHSPSEHRLILLNRMAMAGGDRPLVVDLDTDITHWRADYQLHAGSLAVRDYDEFAAETRQARETTLHDVCRQAAWEHLEYPGRVATNSQATQRARVGMEREESRHVVYQGASHDPRWVAGHRIALRAHAQREMQGEYFLTAVEHAFDSRLGYRNMFTAVRSDTQASYRPPRTTAKPVILGPQPAVVTDHPPGNDLPGMVRVRFAWDTAESNSCWIRFSEMMADNGWGTWFPPHVDQEVLVEFLHGDPDRPVITGRMYNGRNHPAENDVHVTAIRTERGQELRFDDQAGAEELLLRGTHKVQVLAGMGTLTLQDQAGNEIELSPQGGVRIRSASTVTIEAATIELSAGMVTINAGMTRTTGVLQCGTLITNAVVSASYTPGAGNIW
jgi:type VI secretion system secreted protein VgrG